VKIVAIALWLGEVLAAIIMLVLASLHIQTILFTGPILTVTGLLLAFVTRPLRSWTALGFALSGPLVSGFLSLSIAVFNLGPAESYSLVVSTLTAYALLMLPAAVASIRQIVRWETLVWGISPPLFQFSLKSLLMLMTLICVLIAAVKILLTAIGRDESIFFGGFTLVVFVLCGVAVRLFVGFRFVAYRPDSVSKTD